MRVMINEATESQLDFLVAKCQGLRVGFVNTWSGPKPCYWVEAYDGDDDLPLPKYSSDWAQGGPIIERERIAIDYRLSWCVATVDDWDEEQSGPTPLVAAMRAYVSSKLGDEVEVPEELKVCRPGCF